MARFETILDVSANGEATLKLPSDVVPGRYAAVLIISDNPGAVAEPGCNLPTLDLGPWPDNLSLRREDIY